MTIRFRLVLMLLLTVAACCGEADADGLIHQLPADGAWVRYKLWEEGQYSLSRPEEAKAPEEKARKRPAKTKPLPVKSSGSLRLSSVGRLVSAGEPCRWIELKSEVEISGKRPDGPADKLREVKEQRRIILKMLIPEKHLASGADPLAHVRRLYFKDGDREPELVEDEKAKQYEIDRFRPVFPEPAARPVRTPDKIVKSLDPKVGELKCEKLTFDSSYDGPLTRGRRGWWSWRGTHEVWLSQKVPFGVAALKLTANSDEWSGEKGRSLQVTVESTKRLVVSKIGGDARSELPDCQ